MCSYAGGASAVGRLVRSYAICDRLEEACGCFDSVSEQHEPFVFWHSHWITSSDRAEPLQCIGKSQYLTWGRAIA